MAKIKKGPQTWLYPTPVLLVGALVEEKPNFMAVAWGGVVSSAPPMLGVAIRPSRHTLVGIREHGVFSVNIPKTNDVKKADYCGVYSGAKVDKSGVFSVWYGNEKNVPLIEECPICMECKVVQTIELGAHVLVIGEITETHIDEDCLVEGTPSIEKIDPLVYVSGARTYHGIGAYIADAYKA
jgi:flavin reductase (DIM6/NTAB) family NADH-FMN oxidoreductase RutF